MRKQRFSNVSEVASHIAGNNKDVTLLFAFNATGKTRLSMEFKDLVNEVVDDETEIKKVLYYNAFTEDLFSWDNDLENDENRKLNINSNSRFVEVIKNQGKDAEIIERFQYYTKSKIEPLFDLENGEVTFHLPTGDTTIPNIKVSKGEENVFIWSIFYVMIETVIDELKQDVTDRSTHEFDDIEYIYIDDPITSLDENHIFELAIDVKQLLKKAKGLPKFIISTHHSLFYTILFNEVKYNRNINRDKKVFYMFERDENNYYLDTLNDTPFGYHLTVKSEIKNAIRENRIEKYHFALFRNLLEKTATYLGYSHWTACLVGDPVRDGKEGYISRINNYTHNRFFDLDGRDLPEQEKTMLKVLFEAFETHFNWSNNGVDEN